MLRTDYYWGVGILAGVFILLGLAFAESVFVICAGGLLAWLVAAEGVFRQRLRTADATVSVSHPVSEIEIGAGQPFTVRTTVSVDDPLRFPVTVSPTYPDAAVGAPANSVTLDAGETEASTACQFRIPFAGTYDIGPPVATVRGAFGLFEARVGATAGAQVTVEPRDDTDIHVGQAGREFAITFGEHASGDTGAGMDPSETRRYVQGEPASRIDWKATARLDEVYVSEFEVETVRPLSVVLDTRVGDGADVRATELDYRRHVAATLVGAASSYGDPVAFYQVTADGIEAWPRHSASSEQYATVRDRLYTARTPDAVPAGGDDGGDRPTAADRRVIAERLRGGGGAFEARLEPFFRTRGRFDAVPDAPLARAVRTYFRRTGQNPSVALIAGDDNRGEVFEAAESLGRQYSEVLVFVTPSVLFEPPGVDRVDRVYRRYADFERYRTRIDRLQNVTALEVAPETRLQALIDRAGGGRL